MEVPSPPATLNIVDITKTTILVNWVKPAHDGGSRINGYVLEIAEKGSDNFFECASTKANILHHEVTKLKSMTEYELRVKARNKAGFSKPRYAFSTVITKDKRGTLNIQLMSSKLHLTEILNNFFSRSYRRPFFYA